MFCKSDNIFFAPNDALLTPIMKVLLPAHLPSYKDFFASLYTLKQHVQHLLSASIIAVCIKNCHEKTPCEPERVAKGFHKTAVFHTLGTGTGLLSTHESSASRTDTSDFHIKSGDLLPSSKGVGLSVGAFKM